MTFLFYILISTSVSTLIIFSPLCHVENTSHCSEWVTEVSVYRQLDTSVTGCVCVQWSMLYVLFQWPILCVCVHTGVQSSSCLPNTCSVDHNHTYTYIHMHRCAQTSWAATLCVQCTTCVSLQSNTASIIPNRTSITANFRVASGTVLFLPLEAWFGSGQTPWKTNKQKI